MVDMLSRARARRGTVALVKKRKAGPPPGSLLLEHRGRGDIVRISDSAPPNGYGAELAGKRFELGWPMWAHGTKKNDQPKTRIEGWFAREALEPFGAEDDFGVKFEFARDHVWLPVDTAVVELILEKSADGNARLAAVGNERGGGDADPLRRGSDVRRGQGGLW